MNPQFPAALRALDMDRAHRTADPKVRDAVRFMNDGHRARCDTTLTPGTFHVDHVRPSILRGEDHITNYQPLCAHYNTSKGERSTADYRSDTVRRHLGGPKPSASCATVSSRGTPTVA